jgi:hypothetical protein
MILSIRNGINHVLLNTLLKCRYEVRHSPRMVKCILAAEVVCIKTGLIYYGRRQA